MRHLATAATSFDNEISLGGSAKAANWAMLEEIFPAMAGDGHVPSLEACAMHPSRSLVMARSFDLTLSEVGASRFVLKVRLDDSGGPDRKVDALDEPVGARDAIDSFDL